MKINKKILPHIIVGCCILFFIIVFAFSYQRTVGVDATLQVEESGLIKNQEGSVKEDLIFDRSEKQQHKQMTLQEILTKANKRIVIQQETSQ